MKLTPKQVAMLEESGHDTKDRCGFGVELRGAGDWNSARSLRDLELGWIEGGRPQGSELPGLFFANRAGVGMVAEDGDVEGEA